MGRDSIEPTNNFLRALIIARKERLAAVYEAGKIYAPAVNELKQSSVAQW